MNAWLNLLVWLAQGATNTPHAPACATLEVKAQVSDTLDRVEGTVTCMVAREGQMKVVAYPDTLQTPAGLDDVNGLWFYPHGFDPAAMEIHTPQGLLPAREVDSGTANPGRPLGRVQPGALTVSFKTRIPRRRGTFGRHQGTAYLLGGWHPVFALNDDAPQPTTIHYRVVWPAGFGGFVGQSPVTDTRPSAFAGTLRQVVHLPMVLSKKVRLHRSGAAVVMEPERASAPLKHSSWELLELGRNRQASQEILRTLERGATFAESLGAAARPIFVVIAPLRENLVEHFDLGIAVSDRAFQLLPLESLQKYHRQRLWRAQMSFIALTHAHRNESALPATLVADTIGAGLYDMLLAEEYGGEQHAEDLFDRFAVIPEIDALAMAPQIPFVDAYFRAIDETPQRRWQLDDFYHTLPRGKLLYEKSVDRIGRAKARGAVAAYLQHDVEWARVVRWLSGVEETTWEAWLAPYPSVDYALGAIAHDAGMTTVQVEASGPDAANVTEPITVEVEDARGRKYRQQRLGGGIVHVPTEAAPRRVEIDPDKRLVELHLPAGTTARMNNRTPPRWRFLLNNITSLVAVTNQQLALGADFTLRRVEDLRYRLDFLTYYGPGVVQGAIGASRSFGERITPLRLGHRVGVVAAYNWLRVERGAEIPGHQGSVTAYYSFDNRLLPYWSFHGEGLRLYVRGGFGRDAAGTQYRHVQAGASGLYLLRLALGHALVGRLRLDWTFGEAPAQNLFRLGGRDVGGRGFEPDEGRAPRRLIASGEYRHVLAPALNGNVFGLLTVTRVEGALFGDALFLPGVQPDCGREWFYDAGYGLRFIADIFNIAPSTLAVDVGVPLNRCPGERAPRSPVTVYVSFTQSFLSF